MADTPLTKQGRLVRSTLKANHLREIAEQRWTYNDLLTVFGMAMRHALTTESNPHNRIGKNFLNSHGPEHYVGSRGNQRHPAGSKLVRGFIRRSGRESTYWRNAYKAMTGKQYGFAEA